MDQQSKSIKSSLHNRKNVALNLLHYENHLESGSSQRSAADTIGVARSTLRYWKTRKESIPLEQSIIDCFESPAGSDFLHRLITAIQFVMTEVSSCGIRLVTKILELTHLHHFVSSSYESLRKRGIELEEHIIAFGEQEKMRLGSTMSAKKISIAEDETFHPKPCLVAIEPISNFILLEQYSEKRDALSWNIAMQSALCGLNVKVIQCTSDKAKGIIQHVEKNLGAYHSPDIFHMQYEISKATSAALGAKTRKAHRELEEVGAAIEKRKSLLHLDADGKINELNPPLSALEAYQTITKDTICMCEKQQELVSSSKRAIGIVYHPYDLKTGEPRKSVQLADSLHQHLDIIEETATSANLKMEAIKKISKARRLVPALIRTLSFYWSMVEALVDSLGLSEKLECVMRDILIPVEYLLNASKKGKNSQERREIKNTATELIHRLQSISEWQQLEGAEKKRLQDAAIECAGYFQRSSSCVEGRNGYLSLRHHVLHRLSDRKLKALTTVHNYFTKRLDDTTAAERFFNQKPRDLFEYLIEKMPYPGRSGIRTNLLKKDA